MVNYWKNFNNMQAITIINELPYKNDKAWNALRLAGELSNQEAKVNIFLWKTAWMLVKKTKM